MDRLEITRGSRSLVSARADLVALAGLSLLCAAISAIVGIHGEFPLNDDWAYAQATLALLETGVIERPSWTHVPMIPHAVVGSLFCTAFGSSFETLRLTSVLAGWLGVIGTYALCRQIGVPVLLATFGAAVIALNPIHVNLSHTFMTDVPFATITVWSLALLCRGLAKRSWPWIAFGTVLAECAVLTRQPGLAIPIGLVIVLGIAGLMSIRCLLAIAAVSALTAFAYFTVPPLILGPRDSGAAYGFPEVYDQLRESHLAWGAVVRALAYAFYLGIFLAPATLRLGAASRAANRRLVGATLVLTGLATAFVLVYSERLNLPLGLNLIYDLGLGPATLHGSNDPGSLPSAGYAVWFVITVLGFGAGFFALTTLLAAAWRNRHKYRNRADCLLLATFLFFYFPPHLVCGRGFDRYLLPMLPVLIAFLLLICGASPRIAAMKRALQIAVLVVLGGYAVAGTRDYLEHHRCRWILLNELTGRGIKPADINGGFEFNCWYTFKTDPTVLHGQHSDNSFVISLLDKRDGYDAVNSLAWQRLVPPGKPVLTVFEAKK